MHPPPAMRALSMNTCQPCLSMTPASHASQYDIRQPCSSVWAPVGPVSQYEHLSVISLSMSTCQSCFPVWPLSVMPLNVTPVSHVSVWAPVGPVSQYEHLSVMSLYDFLLQVAEIMRLKSLVESLQSRMANGDTSPTDQLGYVTPTHNSPTQTIRPTWSTHPTSLTDRLRYVTSPPIPYTPHNNPLPPHTPHASPNPHTPTHPHTPPYTSHTFPRIPRPPHTPPHLTHIGPHKSYFTTL